MQGCLGVGRGLDDALGPQGTLGTRGEQRQLVILGGDPLRSLEFCFGHTISTVNVPYPNPVLDFESGRPSPIPTCRPARIMRLSTSSAVNWSASKRSRTFADHS